jgi:hypothetical protein
MPSFSELMIEPSGSSPKTLTRGPMLNVSWSTAQGLADPAANPSNWQELAKTMYGRVCSPNAPYKNPKPCPRPLCPLLPFCPQPPFAGALQCMRGASSATVTFTCSCGFSRRGPEGEPERGKTQSRKPAVPGCRGASRHNRNSIRFCRARSSGRPCWRGARPGNCNSTHRRHGWRRHKSASTRQPRRNRCARGRRARQRVGKRTGKRQGPRHPTPICAPPRYWIISSPGFLPACAANPLRAGAHHL